MSLRLSFVLLFGALKQSEAACENFSAMLNTSTCSVNVKWAKETGIITVPTNYKDFGFLNKDSPLEDFQYVLSVQKDVDVGKQEHTCNPPCRMSETAQKYETKRQEEVKEDFKGEDLTEPPSGGLKWWGWLLIVLGVCCCLPLLGLACSAFICYESVEWLCGGGEKRAPKTKKRSVKTPAAPAPASAAPVQTVAVPMTSFQYVKPAQSFVVAPPVYAATPTYATQSVAQTQMYMPTQMRTPAYMSASVAQPTGYVTTAQPQVYAQPVLAQQSTIANFQQQPQQ